MMFYTEVELPEFPWTIDHQSGVMMLGSCFTENIGQKLTEQKFRVDINPFGILYNPQSIAQSLRMLLEKKAFTEDDLFFDQGVWSSFAHHGRFSGTDCKLVLDGINNRISVSHDFLKEAKFLILTFGTSWVYELAETGTLVANCHKIPAGKFRRKRLEVEQIVTEIRSTLTDVLKFNPNLKVLFTISPVRHWKDGATGNQQSKSSLILAVEKILSALGEDVCGYFPAYELMMDELRDYRYYADDMLHPSPLAVEHIFEKFSNVLISAESKKISADVVKVVRAAAHRPLNSGSEEYRKFLLYNLRFVDQLTEKFPFLNFQIEKAHFEKELMLFGTKG